MHEEAKEGSVSAARNRFEKDLRTNVYSKITADEAQIERIFSGCKPNDTGMYLDIGTGRGYVAFSLATKWPRARVVGIDIVPLVLEENRKQAIQQGLKYLQFTEFDGRRIPLENNMFDGTFARYSFHHFPEPALAVCEIARVIKVGGFCFISDPMPDKKDNMDFANKFSLLRNDGHIKYYAEDELIRLIEVGGLKHESTFYTEVMIPRKLDDGYRTLLQAAPHELKEAYHIEVGDEEVTVRMQVMNLLFRK